MAKTISLCDTHRIPYPNATVRAYKLADGTTQIKFKVGKNGTPDRFEVKTNSRGYFCDTNGTIYSVGIFLEEDALVKCTLADGNETTWQVCVDDDTPVNDGRLLGLRTPTSPDNDLEEKWSANSPNDHILDYNELTNRPTINEWMEVEQIVTMEQKIDSIQVDKYAKTITIQAQDGVHPDGWSLVDGQWVCEHNEKRNSPWAIQLIPATGRVAQIVCVRNQTPWRLAITNGVQTLAVIDPSDSEHGKLMALYANAQYNETPNLEKVGFAHNAVFDDTSIENDQAHPLVIDDYTPDVLQIVVQATYTGSENQIYLQSSVTKTRRILLWLQNFKHYPSADDGMWFQYMADGVATPIGFVGNFTIVELYVAPKAIAQVTQTFDATSPFSTMTLVNTTAEQKLYGQMSTIVGTVNQHINVKIDQYTNKVIRGYVFNNGASDVQLTFHPVGGGTSVDVILLAGKYNEFVVAKVGNSVNVIYPVARTKPDEYIKIAGVMKGSVSGGVAYFVKMRRTAATQKRIHINIPYIVYKANGGWNGSWPWEHFGAINGTKIVLDMSEVIADGATQEFIFEFDAFSKSRPENKYGRLVMCFNTDYSTLAWSAGANGATLAVTENDNEEFFFSCYEKTLKGTLSRTASKFDWASGVEVIDEKVE